MRHSRRRKLRAWWNVLKEELRRFAYLVGWENDEFDGIDY